MGVIRTMAVVGALLVSVPLVAQPGRQGWDRSREDRGNGNRGNENRGGKKDRQENRQRGQGNDQRVTPRDEHRGGDVPMGRGESRYNAPGVRNGQRERRDAPRIAVVPPGMGDRYDRGGRYDRGDRYDRGGRGDEDDRFERRGPQYKIPPGQLKRMMPYRYGDRDFRQRDFFVISAWFHSLPPSRLAAYGYYGPSYGEIRYSFRPGIYLSLAVYSQLGVLPYDLEYELGDLPWYLERRIYGDTVLVIDRRTRMVVDIYQLDD